MSTKPSVSFLSMLTAFSLFAVASGNSETAYGSEVSTTINIIGITEPINSCGVAYRGGPQLSDQYSWVSIDSRPEILAPKQGLTVIVSFRHDCADTQLASKYSRSLSLISPSGDIMKLVRDESASRSVERRYSLDCRSSLCWYHVDRYEISFDASAESGRYGLRFSTDYLETVCSNSNGASVCESDVPRSKSFDLRNFVTVKQTVTPASSSDETEPAASEVKEGLQLWASKQKTLRSFDSGSTFLTEFQKEQVKAALRDNPTAEKFICTGIRFESAPLSENIIVRKRAKAACDYAKELNPELSTWFQNKPTKARSFAGKVLLTVKSPPS